MKSIVHAVEKPQDIQYTARSDGYADVWIRKNITKQKKEFDGWDDGFEYVYDEIFFRTVLTQGEVESNIDNLIDEWGKWQPMIPMTKEEQKAARISELEAELKQARTDNDMAIAELTIVLATMMTPEE